METTNLMLTLKFNDGTEALLKINNEDFSFEYGVNNRWDHSEGTMQALLKINSKESVLKTQDFLFTNYKHIIKDNNLKEIIIEIFRPNYEDLPNVFTFTENTFTNFNFTYNNNIHGDNQFMIVFDFIPVKN